MTEVRDSRGTSAVVWVRRGLIAMTVMGIAATAFELATVRHWRDLEQLIPWAALVTLAAATLLALLPRRSSWITARALALIVLGASIYGVVDHTVVNYRAGPLDYRYTDSWHSLSVAQRCWLAVTKSVGPSPTLAPGILG